MPTRRIWIFLLLLVLLLIAHNLVYVTNWNLLLSALYWILPEHIGDEIGLTAVVFAQTWVIAIGVTVITATDNKLMADACADVGCPFAWTMNAVIHYLPPILLTHYLRSSDHPLLRDPKRLLAAWVWSVTFIFLYGLYMDPETRYVIPTSLRTFVSWTLTFVALFVILLQRVVSKSSNLRVKLTP